MQTRLIVVGGFLGAGKTTLLLAAARLLTGRGHRVGLITNDQGHDLVDTTLAHRQQIPVTEVAGGCFCCRFPDMLTALERLARTVAPDVILAEPVGSCTDLMATVLRPLAHLQPDAYQLAPLTVLRDAERHAACFSPTVNYLFDRQLAEAEIIVLNKVDLLSTVQCKEIQSGVQAAYSHAQLFTTSAQDEVGIESWLDAVLSQSSRLDRSLALDYTRYAAAEAELGWLNAQGRIQASQPFCPQNWLKHLLLMLDGGFCSQGAAIAHIKAHVSTPTMSVKASLTQSGGLLTWDEGRYRTLDTHNKTGADSVTRVASFILNARVHTAPQVLRECTRYALTEVTPPPYFQYELTRFECFSPLPPQPTYRLVNESM